MPKDVKRINNIPLRDPRDNQDKQLMGFLIDTAEFIRYGKITVEITVSKGKFTNVSHSMDGASIKQSVNLYND